MNWEDSLTSESFGLEKVMFLGLSIQQTPSVKSPVNESQIPSGIFKSGDGTAVVGGERAQTVSAQFGSSPAYSLSDCTTPNEELPTVGIVLCAHNNEAMVELTLPKDTNIFASKYQLYLPSKEELKRELEKIESEIDEFGLEVRE